MPPPENTAETPETDVDLSIAEHEAQFQRGSERHTEAPASKRTDDEPPPDDTTPPADTTRTRDASGRFQPRERQRARSQRAGPDDVPRIASLTERLRTAERERDEWKAKAETPGERSPVVSDAGVDRETGDRRSPGDDRAESTPREAVRPAARVKPEPGDTNADGTPKYKTYEDYLDARDQYNRGTWDEEQAQRAEAARVSADWRTRVEAAKSKYDNFEEVALLKPTKIPAGSLVDAFILEDEGGADVLYHFQQNDAELTRVLAMKPFQAVKYLSLLSQRLHDSDAEPEPEPVATGATATPRLPVTRPPAPVRTVPARRADEPPGDDASLAEHERVYGQRQRRH